MIIWAAIYLLGLASLVFGSVHLVCGIQKKEWKRVGLAVAIPAVLWIGIYTLHEADRRFIEEETRKNGGELPGFVW